MSQVDVPAQVPPEQMNYHERLRAQEAADHAAKLFPGPIGAYLAREFTCAAQIGLRFDQRGLTKKCMDAVLASPLPPRQPNV